MGDWSAGDRSCVGHADDHRPDSVHAEKCPLKGYFYRSMMDEPHVKTSCDRQRLIHAVCEPASAEKETYPHYPQRRVNAGQGI